MTNHFYQVRMLKLTLSNLYVTLYCPYVSTMLCELCPLSVSRVFESVLISQLLCPFEQGIGRESFYCDFHRQFHKAILAIAVLSNNKYYSYLALFNFGDRTRISAFNAVWPSAWGYIFCWTEIYLKQNYVLLLDYYLKL